MCRICVRNGESPQEQDIRFDPDQHKQVIFSEDEYNLLTPLDFSAKPTIYQKGKYLLNLRPRKILIANI